jgi:hypothetical protein
MADMYAVVEFNQASGRPIETAAVYWSLAEAEEDAAYRQKKTREVGRREEFRVFEMTEVDHG